MLATVHDLLATAIRTYGAAEMAKPFRQLQATRHVRVGADPSALARQIRSTRGKILQVANADDPIHAVFGINLGTASDPDLMSRARRGIGQMLLGTLAEHSFERSYRNIVQPDELRLQDTTSGRTDTDYRVFNGRDRPVFRINIKFHGSVFRKALDLVRLAPDDCFPLATYKIHLATRRQEEEFLPYLFVIVTVPGLAGDDAGNVVPEDLAHLTSLYLRSSQPRKRDFEDLVVRHLIHADQTPAVATAINDIRDRIETAVWRVISARRANRLLHERLFQRVYAVRVRGFASNYRRAEVDMHFSIRDDLTPLAEMLELLRDHGLQGLSTRIERGDL